MRCVISCTMLLKPNIIHINTMKSGYKQSVIKVSLLIITVVPSSFSIKYGPQLHKLHKTITCKQSQNKHYLKKKKTFDGGTCIFYTYTLYSQPCEKEISFSISNFSYTVINLNLITDSGCGHKTSDSGSFKMKIILFLPTSQLLSAPLHR